MFLGEKRVIQSPLIFSSNRICQGVDFMKLQLIIRIITHTFITTTLIAGWFLLVGQIFRNDAGDKVSPLTRKSKYLWWLEKKNAYIIQRDCLFDNDIIFRYLENMGKLSGIPFLESNSTAGFGQGSSRKVEIASIHVVLVCQGILAGWAPK